MDHPDTKLTTRLGLPITPVPLGSYTSPAQFELERERVFRRAWLIVGRVEELPKAGSYVVKEIEVCAASVLVIRGKDGEIRAFHNVCSHRGNLLVWDRAGSRTTFRCNYHHWTYSRDGRLLGVPDEEQFFDVDKGKCGLTPIRTEVWEGWIFVNLDPGEPVELSEFLGGMEPFLAGIAYPYAANPLVVEIDLHCNWKIVADAFAEAYHIPALHPRTIGDAFSSSRNPSGQLLDARAFGPHSTVSMYGNPDYAPGTDRPVAQVAGRFMAADGELQAYLAHPAINPTRTNAWALDANFLFPNFHLDFSPRGFVTHQFWPLSPDRTRHESRYYVPPARSIGERFAIEHYCAQVLDVLLEDVSNVERTHRGIASGAKTHMHLQDNEVLLRHAYEHLERWRTSETAREALGIGGPSHG